MANRSQSHANIMYGWALNKQGVPVPIAAANRGERYFCPVCEGDMVAKMGDTVQHHFAHVNLLQCTPEVVARKVAGLWIIQVLRERIKAGQPVEVTWEAAQGEKRAVNLLHDVTEVADNIAQQPNDGDIKLLDKSRRVRVVLFLGLLGTPTPEQVAHWTAQKAAVLLLNPALVRSGNMTIESLLASSQVLGGWWLVDEATLPPNLVLDPQTMRSILRLAVVKPPHRFHAALESEGDMNHLLPLDGRKLWLPPQVWQDVVGGQRNRLTSGVTIMLQEWPMDDGGRIALFYVEAHDSTAVAIRRFPAGEHPNFDLGSSAFWLQRVTALDIARQLSGGEIHYPI